MEKVQNQKLSIHEYDQLKVLGKGSYAKVVLVRKLTNNQIYAMKILKKKYIEKKKQEEHTLTERMILIECIHPFIIQMHSSFQTPSKLFMVLEFCQGGELFNLISKRRRFTEEVCRFYASQMVLAIEYLHSKNIIYRDLKPENVLLDNSGYIRISDFGLAKKEITGKEGAFSVCGTPEYLAPEVINKIGHGKPVDWWTLGCILFEMFTGFPPFQEENRQKLFNSIKNDEIKLPLNSSQQIKSLFQGLLNRDPNQRLGSGPSEAEEIKNHPWFSRIEWDSILNKMIKPPFIPKIKNEIDVSCFDDEFLQEQILSVSEDQSIKDQKIYANFSYDENGYSLKSSLKNNNLIEEEVLKINSVESINQTLNQKNKQSEDQIFQE